MRCSAGGARLRAEIAGAGHEAKTGRSPAMKPSDWLGILIVLAAIAMLFAK